MRHLAGALALGCWLLSTSLAWAQSPPAGYATVEGGQVYYESCGAGPRAVVLLHDGVLHSAGFDPAWPMLCKTFHVVRYDRRGYGKSAAATQPYSPVEDLKAVLRAASVEQVTLVGGSAGGGIAVDFALAHPELVDRLVLVGPEVSGFPPSAYFKARMLATGAALQRGGVAEALKDPRIIAPDHADARQRAAALLTANMQNLTHPDPQRPARPARPLLSTLDKPTLLLVGENDFADVQVMAGGVAALMPHASLAIVPDAGHLLYLEQPQAFVDAVAGFVEPSKTP